MKYSKAEARSKITMDQCDQFENKRIEKNPVETFFQKRNS